ncbi:hypothetical protein EDC04DRAFT_2609876 [Pisolithus marmoratus]|nr:hypothetical protein EDC04DRAFT_2609876 [Pisolithus marmoratus]
MPTSPISINCTTGTHYGDWIFLWHSSYDTKGRRTGQMKSQKWSIQKMYLLWYTWTTFSKHSTDPAMHTLSKTYKDGAARTLMSILPQMEEFRDLHYFNIENVDHMALGLITPLDWNSYSKCLPPLVEGSQYSHNVTNIPKEDFLPILEKLKALHHQNLDLNWIHTANIVLKVSGCQDEQWKLPENLVTEVSQPDTANDREEGSCKGSSSQPALTDNASISGSQESSLSAPPLNQLALKSTKQLWDDAGIVEDERDPKRPSKSPWATPAVVSPAGFDPIYSWAGNSPGNGEALIEHEHASQYTAKRPYIWPRNFQKWPAHPPGRLQSHHTRVAEVHWALFHHLSSQGLSGSIGWCITDMWRKCEKCFVLHPPKSSSSIQLNDPEKWFHKDCLSSAVLGHSGQLNWA